MKPFVICSALLIALTLPSPPGYAQISPAEHYGYGGREPDGSGLVYARSRYYDPATGRFLQRDTLGLAAGIDDYGYVGGNPANAVDPDGTDPKGPESKGFWSTFASYFVFGGHAGEAKYSNALSALGGNINSQQANEIVGGIGQGVTVGAGTFACVMGGCAAAAAGASALDLLAYNSVQSLMGTYPSPQSFGYEMGLGAAYNLTTQILSERCCNYLELLFNALGSATLVNSGPAFRAGFDSPAAQFAFYSSGATSPAPSCSCSRAPRPTH